MLANQTFIAFFITAVTFLITLLLPLLLLNYWFPYKKSSYLHRQINELLYENQQITIMLIGTSTNVHVCNASRKCERHKTTKVFV